MCEREYGICEFATKVSDTVLRQSTRIPERVSERDKTLTNTSSIQHIPLVPLHALSSFTTTVQTLHRSLHIRPQARSLPNPLTTLLPYCSTRPPIPRSPLNVLSEVCSGVAGLADMATTDSGRAALRDVCPAGEEGVVEELVEFWGVEIIAD